ncbi:MAG: PKD domain-containing protein [Bacteroidia bacterium]|nr:PKD domain-containing protein [Bacteroidia bacterium]
MKFRALQKSIKIFVSLLLTVCVKTGLAQCNASFVYTLAANGNATFLSTSSPTTSGSTYTWAFGNGSSSITSGGTITAFTSYTLNGVYPVSLTYFSGSCIDTMTTNIMVNSLTGGTCGIVPQFGYSQGNNLVNTYINNSTGTTGSTTYSWNYGDGTTGVGSATSHTYTTPGAYLVYLTAINNTTQGCIQSTVMPVVAGLVNFTNTPSGSGIFTLTSISAPAGTFTDYDWNYGNGQPNYTVTGTPSAVVMYTSNGAYPVTLQITNATNPPYSGSVTKTLVVSTYTSAGCNLQAGFNYTQINGGISLQNTSQGVYSGTSYTVNYGDGATSNTFPSIHTYSSTGLYTVQLIASNPFIASCTSSFALSVSVCSLNFNAVSQTTSSVVNFTGTASPSNTNTFHYWYFGDGNSAQGTNSFVVSNTYTSNAVYQVMYGIASSAPFCSLAISAPVNPTCTIDANFISTPGAVGLYSFSSTSTGANTLTTYSWDYGDNSAIGSGTSTSHLYSANGTFTVKLIANSGFGCIDSVMHTVTIVNSGTCNASFTYAANSNGNVSFLSTSSGAGSSTTYTWDYGTGTSLAGSVSSNYTYPAPGIYTVTLHILTSPGGCSSSNSQTVLVPGTPCNLNADFLAILVSTNTFSFTNTTTGTVASTSYTWDFGDGTFSNSFQPVHTYSTMGQYQVHLFASNASGWPVCTSSYTLFVTTSYTCNMLANFSHTLGLNGSVNFSNTSTYNNQAYAKNYWNFGDGVISYATNPIHNYSNAGSYLVSLTIKDTITPICHDSLAQYINVTGIPCSAISNFTLIPTNSAGYWFAIPDYPWNLSAASWTWGDGDTSNTLYTSHQYSASGTYSICLTVTASCGSVSSFCMNQLLSKGSEETSGIVNVNVIPPALSLRVNEEVLNTGYSAYPNPNNGRFTISVNGLSPEQTDIAIYNLLGSCIYTETFNTFSTNLSKIIDLESQISGVYLLKLRNGNREITKRIVIQR